MRNSLDAVADRDFALDYLYAVAVLFGHLSRIGEELCLWSSAEFGFATLPEAAATGSSMMPQKLNPDVAELARGKAGTAIGRLTGLLAVVKGLPLAYDRDLQEDKAPVFAARRDVAGALGALGVLVGGLELDHDRLAAAAADPAALATDAAEALVAAGVPFRDAHEEIAAQVRAGTFEPPAPGHRRFTRPWRRRRRRRRRPREVGPVNLPAALSVELAGRSLLRLRDWMPAEVDAVLDFAAELKSLQAARVPHRLLEGRTLGLLFRQHSTRTRVSLEVAAAHLGATAVYLASDQMQLARGETVEDTAPRALALPRRDRDPHVRPRRARAARGGMRPCRC